MLYTIVVILIIAWLLGGIIPGIALYNIGGLVHIILVVALVLLVVQLLTGRRQL